VKIHNVIMAYLISFVISGIMVYLKLFKIVISGIMANLKMSELPLIIEIRQQPTTR